MKKNLTLQVFFEQPAIKLPDSQNLSYFIYNGAQLSYFISNGARLNEWLKTNPTLDHLKVAALLEGATQKRVLILDRLLTRIYKLEKTNTLNALTK